MSDPKRLSSGDDLGASLLASARGDEPRAGSRARAAAALGLVVGTAAVVSTGTAAAAGGSIAPKAIGASGAGAKAATALWLKLLAAGVVTVAVAGGAAMNAKRSAVGLDATLAERSHAPRAHAPTGAPSPVMAPPASPAPETPPPVANAAPEITPPLVNAVPEPAAPAATAEVARSAPRGSTTTSSSAPAESPLARELRSLDVARSALAAGNPSGALAELDRHDRNFPAGSLRTEARVLRVEALLARGDGASARRLARDLLARDPSGPHAQRLRTIADAAP